MRNVIRTTNTKLANWYLNAKKDYNVNGTGKCTIEGDKVIIRTTEGEEKREWSMTFYKGEFYDADYFFNVWMEEGN